MHDAMPQLSIIYHNLFPGLDARKFPPQATKAPAKLAANYMPPLMLP